MAHTRWILAVALSVLAGCSVSPPVPLERDPLHSMLPLSEDERLPATFAIAPVTASFRDEPTPRWGSAPDDIAPLTSTSAVPGVGGLAGAAAAGMEPKASPADRGVPLEELEYSWVPYTVPQEELQDRLVRLVPWAVSTQEARLLETPGDAASLRYQAEGLNADLLLQVDVLEHRVAWIERDGLWWWSNFLLFYGPGIYPVVLIPDEVYDVAFRARLSVVHVESGEVLLSKVLTAHHRRSLNDAQRGWSITGLLFLYPWTLDEDDYQRVQHELEPHALKGLELQILQALRDELPASLPAELRPVPKKDEPASEPTLAPAPAEPVGETWALVIGSNGPVGAGAKKAPLSWAQKDATDFANQLIPNTVTRERLSQLTDFAATRGGVLATLEELSRQIGKHDHLIFYYSGYGRTNAAGVPELTLDGTPLALTTLSQATAKLIPETARVTFIFDTGFTRGAKTYPGGGLPPETGYLAELWLGHPRWSVLTAAGVRQTAWESKTQKQGLFTAWLLKLAAANADTNEDGAVDAGEAEAYLQFYVPDAAKEETERFKQTPRLLGSWEKSAPLLRLGAPSSPDESKAPAEEPLEPPTPPAQPDEDPPKQPDQDPPKQPDQDPPKQPDQDQPKQPDPDQPDQPMQPDEDQPKQPEPPLEPAPEEDQPDLTPEEPRPETPLEPAPDDEDKPNLTPEPEGEGDGQ